MAGETESGTGLELDGRGVVVEVEECERSEASIVWLTLVLFLVVSFW